MGKAGRPRGSRSWPLNPDNIAAHHAEILLEFWLSGAPIEAASLRLGPALKLPDVCRLLRQCWTQQPINRRFTVPPRVKRDLCKVAVAFVEVLHQAQERALNSERYKAWLEVAAGVQIAAQADDVPIRSLYRRRRSRKDWKKPELSRVLQIVNRRSPAITLRRKAKMRHKA
jgi:hypothetical protein